MVFKGNRIALISIAIIVSILCIKSISADQITINNISKLGIVSLSSGENIMLADIITPEIVDLGGLYTSLFVGAVKKDLIGRTVSYQTSQNIEYDRHNFKMVYLTMQNGKSVQEYLVSNGLAVVFQTTKTKTANIDKLFELERKARGLKKGMWKNNLIAVMPAKELEDNIDQFKSRFVLVSATINEVSDKPNTLYLNTSKNWKEDTTLAVDKRTKRGKTLISAINKDLFSKKNVIVRGWVEEYNGPLIKIINKSQIQVVGF